MSFIFENDQAWQTLKNGIKQLAQQEVLPRFRHVDASTKADGSVLTEADTEMQKATEAFLNEHWPQFTFLGEESSAQEQKDALASNNGCWILDPVDGTSNFASDIPVYSVSLALIIQGDVKLGMVYDPDRDELFAARKGQGAELNDRALIAQTTKTELKKCIGLVDFKRLQAPLSTELVLKPPYASQRSIGSVALDWCWVAAGRGQLYCHGAQNIWDYAAGWLILNEAGGKSATLTGETVLVSEVVKRSAVAATTPALFDDWFQILQDYQHAN
ncbi:inositol monophosphatase family protein [Thiomicrospira sp. S5]|uniref:inositol monophosphatase family protein n=1 Tax=Thiomicrospira sp. S5 TaxID=1803865 RepID=UPI000F8C9CDC|nr:inositol monophosphatase [Thiomicrospira sp. S5]